MLSLISESCKTKQTIKKKKQRRLRGEDKQREWGCEGRRSSCWVITAIRRVWLVQSNKKEKRKAHQMCSRIWSVPLRPQTKGPANKWKKNKKLKSWTQSLKKGEGVGFRRADIRAAALPDSGRIPLYTRVRQPSGLPHLQQHSAKQD